MKLSVIVATRNRAPHLRPCLDSIAAAAAKAAPIDAEIVVVDNGSTDNTFQLVMERGQHFSLSGACAVRAKGRTVARPQSCTPPCSGRIVRLHDDCRLHPDYVNDLLRHHTADAEPVFRGGRIELGDPTDLPLTIKTTPDRITWNRRMNSARRLPITGEINGCNMTIPRLIVERLGPFDERFGSGAIIPAGGDSDYLFRAYLAYFTLEYVPDMAVLHYHGRKTPDVGRKLLQGYLIGNGALLAKHAWKHPNLARPFYWDIKNAIKEIAKGGISTTSQAYFSHRDKVACTATGIIRYLLRARSAQQISVAH